MFSNKNYYFVNRSAQTVMLSNKNYYFLNDFA